MREVDRARDRDADSCPLVRAVASVPAAMPRRSAGADPMIALLFGCVKTAVPQPVTIECADELRRGRQRRQTREDKEPERDH